MKTDIDLNLIDSKPNPVMKWLVISSVFSVLLLIIRLILTGNRAFIFLPWNLFLAFVPYVVSNWMMNEAGEKFNKYKFFACFVAWLLFIPNSFYIITDLFHLRFREESSRWFDLTLILSFAWNGIIMGILSVRQIERIYLSRFPLKWHALFLFPVMWLIALGIYIGRFLRFNSWDVLTNPFKLIGDISELVFMPHQNFEEWGMISCFAVLMTIMYITIKKISKVI